MGVLSCMMASIIIRDYRAVMILYAIIEYLECVLRRHGVCMPKARLAPKMACRLDCMLLNATWS